MMVEKYSDKKDTSCGADEVFPILVYICIKGKIQKLKSNINYIILFRNEVRLQGMEDYYKENFNGVIKFIENLKFTDLKIDEDEFNKNIKLYENKINNISEKNKNNSLEEIYNKIGNTSSAPQDVSFLSEYFSTIVAIILIVFIKVKILSFGVLFKFIVESLLIAVFK